MTANRKADLQRKLTLAPVAKPPAGLAERIKREIPKDLRFNAETERERLSKAVGFNLRVAASILVLVSSAYLGLQLLSRLDENPQPVTQRPAAKIPVALRTQPKVLTTTAAVKEAAREERQAPAAPPPVLEKRADTRDRRLTVVASAPARPAEPAAAPTAQSVNAMAERKASGAVAMDRVDAKFANVVADVETTTSPVSGKEMRYSAKDKNVQVVATSKLQDEQITPWSSVSAEAKLKILQTELAAGGDKKVIARVAREAGLTDFANLIEKR
jgi:hypothetical protein